MSKLATYSEIIDRSLDRFENAIEAARSATYSSGQFARDVSASWNDWALLTALPLSVFGLDVSARPAIPTVEFIVTDKTVKPTLVAQLPQINNVTGTDKEKLKRPGGGGASIPKDKIKVTLAGTEYLYVMLDSPAIDALGTITANVYQGNIIGTPANAVIARVKVVWPG